MEEKQRFSNFLLVAAVIIWGWFVFVVPKMNPPKNLAEKKLEQNDSVDEKVEGEVSADPAGGEKKAEKIPAGDAKNDEKKPAAPVAKPVKVKDYPQRDDVQIGSTDVAENYRLLVKFHSTGAVISEVQLIDPRYHDLSKLRQPLKLIQIEPEAVLKTLQLDIPEVDLELKPFKKKLTDVNWELVKDELKEDAATWRYVTPDDGLEIQKKFSIKKAVPGQNNEFEAYKIGFEIVLINHGEKKRTVHYELSGPVGIALENRFYAQKTRDLALGFISPAGAITSKLLTPATLHTNLENQKEEEWYTPLKYAGVDSQYFAALLLPEMDQNKEHYFESSKAVFADEEPANAKTNARLRNVTVQFKSVELDLPAAKPAKKEGKAEDLPKIAHQFHLFAGPKRADLLRPMGAENIIDYGISGRLGIPQALLTLLSFYNAALSFLPWSYGFAIILLTITVRSCMFPLSRKQAVMAAKMQELQPELTALKEKYKATPEKFASAQMELFSRHKCNPLSGCLWALVQLPIFFGLYQAFTISVEMRGAPFLWVNNLAAPDALFDFPGNVPMLGPSFNLLPILTVCLFLVQQKYMMPPATTPEQEMQHKMFFYMTIGMGLMFYSVPAGMCVYFIASSLWGLAERKLLPKPKLGGSSGGVIGGTGGTSSPSKFTLTTKAAKNPGRG
ncbi:MAG: 60 kDa inner rane insertion protein [Planctomycetaceae bacterium]|nr:60 kDa inner rane insertion protein [Planctomycetaceae bacterium]